MDRRGLLRVLGAAAATAGLPVDSLAALTGPYARRTASRAWFTEGQRSALTGMVDAIIPATDTPGAVEAGVVDFLEVIVSEWMDRDDRIRFMRGLADAMRRGAAASSGSVEEPAPPPGRVAPPAPDDGSPLADPTPWVRVLSELAAEGRAALDADPDADPAFFHRLRALTLQGFYTSEVGMMEELLHRPLPGRFDGCADLSTIARPVPEDF
ncbi:MAG TPA: gluconate 2-dehydrogenase subunit 3 family protein [Longimicrobiales bacterium]|nr:gluconate 2-dehydrogenase subunit 3 family protein [Longimicrobiales bacterium]